MPQKLLEKARIQIEDVVWRKNWRETVRIGLSFINRRRIPLPSAIYLHFGETDALCLDLGDEKFLEKYMVPENGLFFVDVGASIGAWSVFVAEKGNKVYAFEPSPKAYRILVKNARDYPNIQPFPYALGDRDAIGKVGFSAYSVGGAVNKDFNLPGGGTAEIAIRSLDSLNLSNIGVIKIDTEGYETPILVGAKETIEREKPRLIIEVHRACGKAAKTFTEQLERVEAILQNFGYSWVIHYRYINLHEQQPFVIAEPKK